MKQLQSITYITVYAVTHGIDGAKYNGMAETVTITVEQDIICNLNPMSVLCDANNNAGKATFTPG